MRAKLGDISVLILRLLAHGARRGHGRALEQRVRDPRLVVPAARDEPLVQRTRARALALLMLEVDVRFPQQLGHRQLRLRDRELEDRARGHEVLQLGLELCVLDPCGRVGGVVLEVLLVELSCAVKLAEL